MEDIIDQDNDDKQIYVQTLICVSKVQVLMTGVYIYICVLFKKYSTTDWNILVLNIRENDLS